MMVGMDEQNLVERGANRSQRPQSRAFREFIAGQWGEAEPLVLEEDPGASFAQVRRARLGAQFAGERLVIPAGALKTRSNDTDYRFRPHTAFAHLTGLGMDFEPDAVLVLHPIGEEEADAGEGLATIAAEDAPSSCAPTHEAILYVRPPSGKDSPEFYADLRYGEFWVGRRPSLEEVELLGGIRTAHLDTLRDALAKDAGEGRVRLRVIQEADAQVSALVEEIRQQAGLPGGSVRASETALTLDEKLAEAASELRLIKDSHEIGEMRRAVAATKRGFERVVRALPQASGHPRGERVIEAAFEAGARIDGNGLGYETIAAAGNHATTLHWITNTGPVREGDLVLLDAGVEVNSLYTADITRTLPVSGRYSPRQREVWEAVVAAADAGFAAARPGNRFRDVHDAAMEVIAERLEAWGLLPVPASVALKPEGQQHRRWMVHGTSHHLGIDVHDCAQARAEHYIDALLEPGMVFTIEPGLYFKAEDLAVPEDFRGIGARCEDDVLITPDGCENLSACLPRSADAIEAWIAELWAQ